MLPIATNPYFDAVLKEHVIRAARRRGVTLADLERAFASERSAIEFLKECGPDAYETYLEDASEAVDHVGWILIDKATGCEISA